MTQFGLEPIWQLARFDGPAISINVPRANHRCQGFRARSHQPGKAHGSGRIAAQMEIGCVGFQIGP
jgi:hypothetical protein